MESQLLDHAAKQETQVATKIWTKGSTIAGTIKVTSGQLMGFRILFQKWAGRAKRATTKQVQDRKETTNARGFSKRANKR